MFLSITGGCTGSSESTLVKMPHCWKSNVVAHLSWGFIIFFKTKGQNLQHRSTVLQEDLSFSITIIFHDFLYKKEFNSLFWFQICYELKKCMLHFCSHFQLIIYTFIWPSHIWNIHFSFQIMRNKVKDSLLKTLTFYTELSVWTLYYTRRYY